MALKRGRKPKKALNKTKQIEEEKSNALKGLENDDAPQYDIKVEVTEEKAELPKETTPEIEDVFEKSLKDELEKIKTESPEHEDNNGEKVETQEEIDVKPTKEQLMRLSKKDLRYYQRTGKLPN